MIRFRSSGTDIATLLQLGRLAEVGDDQLLDRFVLAPDAAGAEAFRVLVERHGPMVHASCRGLLGNSADADDAFQATFLVLARKAGSVRSRRTLGPWLHGVAVRVSRGIRGRVARQRVLEQPLELGDLPAVQFEEDGLAEAVHEEIGRLPESLRRPVVLCCLESRSYGEAARSLGLSDSTVRGRLHRARAQLAARLRSRGFDVAGLAPRSMAPILPTPPLRQGLMDETVHLVSRWAVLGRLAFDATPRSVLQLAEGVISSMIWNSMKFAASGTVLAVGILSTVVVGQQARVTEKIPGKGQSTSAISKGAESAKAQPPLEGSLNRRHSADEIKLRNQQIRERLYTKVDLGLYDLAPFTEFLKAIRRVSAKNSDLGVPIYVDPIGMQEVNQPADVMVPTHGERGGTIEDRLSVALRSLGLAYVIRDGFVWVNSRQSIVESRLSQVEEKLDRILELLEKERR